MKLPEGAAFCLERLEKAGFPAYVVGGCVRDWVLGIQPHDYDICTGAKPPEICQVFSDLPLIHSGEKHGTIGVIFQDEVYEITTFRTEGDYRDSRHPGWVKFVPQVEADLARRDFTINAMAWSPAAGLTDPFGGQEDLQNRVLSTVGDPETRFREDALRILRGVRFALRYGLTPRSETMNAMVSLAPTLHALARERVYAEVCQILLLAKGEDLLTFCPILTQAVPELAPMVGFLQHNRHHAYDVYTHTAHVVGQMPRDLTLRWAALLHDTGKPQTFTLDDQGQGHFYGHPEASRRIAHQVLTTLKAPTALREAVETLVENHMLTLTPDKKILRKRMGKYGPELVEKLLTLQEGDFSAKGTGLPQPEDFSLTRKALQELLQEPPAFTLRDLAIGGKDLLALGYPSGPILGQTLNALLEQVQQEQLPNERQALLEAAAQSPPC